MKHIQIKNSCEIWKPSTMKLAIQTECACKYGSPFADKVMGRSYVSMYIEWWLHNIGYYLAQSAGDSKFWHNIASRCKDVDLTGKGEV